MTIWEAFPVFFVGMAFIIIGVGSFFFGIWILLRAF